MIVVIAFLFTLVIRSEARGFLYGIACPFIYVTALVAGSFTLALGMSIVATALAITSYIILGEIE